MILGYSWEEGRGGHEWEWRQGKGGEKFADVTCQCLGLQCRDPAISSPDSLLNKINASTSCHSLHFQSDSWGKHWQVIFTRFKCLTFHAEY